MSNPFEDELRRRGKAPDPGAPGGDPFAEELARRQQERSGQPAGFVPPPEHTAGEQIGEAGEYLVRGANKGLLDFLTMPYQALRGASNEVAEGMRKHGTKSLLLPEDAALPAVEEMSAYKPFLQQPKPKTDMGRYAQSVGEVIGSSVVPSAAVLRASERAAAAAPAIAQRIPQTASGAAPAIPPQAQPGAFRSALQEMGETIAANPGAAVKADVVASTGAGIAQEMAKDSGFGPAGQAVAGMVGGMAPSAVAAPFAMASRARRSAQATAAPHAKVADALRQQDMPIDDLAHSVAVGHTGLDPHNTYAQRVIDTLGEEMVRANGNRPAALQATLARLETEGGVAASTARDQLRRVVQSQAGNDLMLGEYPAVAAANAATRRRDPGVIMRELDHANNMPNAEAANRHRLGYDPGRIEDAPSHWMLDTVANSGTGEASATVRNAIDNRVASMAQRMGNTIRSWAPFNADTYDVHAALERMRQAGRAAYRAVYDAPGGTAVNYPMLHGLLQRTVDRHLTRLGGLGGDHAAELRKAIDGLYNSRPAGTVAREAIPDLQDEVAALRGAVREGRRQGLPKDQLDDMARRAEAAAEQLRLTRRDATPPTQQYLMPTLEQLQVMRSGIRRQMNDPTRPDLGVVLGPLYRDVTRVMERSSPRWRVANQQWADLMLDDVARELGENIGFQAGPRFREQMREFSRLAPEAQNFVRVEVAQKFADKLANMGDGENLAKLFKTAHLKHLVRTMFGDDAAVQMRRISRDSNVATKSKGMMGGSPTQPRQARQAAMNADLDLLGQVDQIPTSLGGWLGAIKKYTIGRAQEKRNKEVAKILTTPVRNTAQMAEQIERLRQAQAVAEQYRQPRVRTRAVGAQIGNAAEGADDYFDEQGRLNVSIPRKP